ncbi:MAG TPA: TonB-dependent receptor [Rhizomicrobium sp.]|nr:TonB-dependent receptor [Rhizomicrobium sp.]
MCKRLIMALLASTALAAPALAQSDDSASSQSGNGAQANPIETVYVTARKRTENEQTVPIAISAYTQGDLDKLNIRTVEDLKYVSPSVYIAPTTFRQDTLNITIRGQRDFDSSSGQSVMSFDPAAAVYMDGVYLARPVGLTGALFDIDNVEVLKGPQGTLVGRNSTGGAILYTTHEPTDKYGGYVTVTGGDYGRGGVEGAINIPLADNLFFRAAGQVNDQKGYIANYYFDPASGYRNNQPAMGSDKIAGNFSLKWVGDDSFNIVLRADISAEHDTGSSYHDLGYFVGKMPYHGKTSICNIPGTCTGFTDLLGHVIAPYYTTVTASGASGVSTNPAAYNSALASIAREQRYGFWSTEQTVSNADVGHYQTVSATVNKTFDDVDVKWLTAYRWWDNRGTSIGRGLSYDTADYEYMVPDYKSYQSELTVNGNALGDRLKWTTGMFFFQEDSPDDGGLFYLYLPSAVTPQPVSGKQITLQDGTRNSQRNTSYAAYAQATYSITPDTRFTAGVRYTYDERHAFLDLQDDIFPATANSTLGVANGVFDSTPVTYNGIAYQGQTHACALTDTTGKLKPLASCATNVDASFHKPTYTLAIDHDLWDGTLVYATTRSGYRSGAINSAAVQPDAIVAKPENVTDYEVGIKSDSTVWNMPVRINLDGYFSDYHDIQTLVALPNVTIATTDNGGPCTQAAYNANACNNVTNDNVTLNAKTAHIHGIEWDITILPIPELTLNAAGSYLDARYTDFTYTPPPGYLLPTGTTDLSGSPFPLPAWQLNETATYASGLKDLFGVPIDDLTFTAHYYWQSRYLANMTGFNPSQRTGAYGMLNLRFDVVNVADKNVDIGVFMNNVVNTPACLPEYQGVLNSAPNGSFGIADTAGILQCVPLAPRMTGVQVSYRF